VDEYDRIGPPKASTLTQMINEYDKSNLKRIMKPRVQVPEMNTETESDRIAEMI
jgi:hypothetical protein